MNRLEKFLIAHKDVLTKNLGISEEELLNRTYGIIVHFKNKRISLVDSSNIYYASWETRKSPEDAIDFETIVREVVGYENWKKFTDNYHIKTSESMELGTTRHSLQFLEIYKDGLLKSSNFDYIDMNH